MTENNIETNTLQPEHVFLLPNQILTDPHFEMWGDVDAAGAETDDDQKVKALAASLESVGQEDDVIVMPRVDPEDPTEELYVVRSGHRRRRAALYINEARSRSGRPLFRLRCRVDRTLTADQAFQAALATNLQRKNFTVLHLAHVVERLQGFDPECAPDVDPKFKAVARKLGVSPAQVSEALKLQAGLSPKLRRQVLAGELSPQSAKLVMQTVRNQGTEALGPEAVEREQVELVEEAQEIQDGERIERVLAEVQAGRMTQEEAERELAQGQEAQEQTDSADAGTGDTEVQPQTRKPRPNGPASPASPARSVSRGLPSPRLPNATPSARKPRAKPPPKPYPPSPRNRPRCLSG